MFSRSFKTVSSQDSYIFFDMLGVGSMPYYSSSIYYSLRFCYRTHSILAYIHCYVPEQRKILKVAHSWLLKIWKEKGIGKSFVKDSNET